MDLISRAILLATYAHSGQTRKHNGSPYILHPARVAGMVGRISDNNHILVAAAWTHDVIEDCGLTEADLACSLGPEVAGIVSELTNRSKIDFPDAPRAERKAADVRRLSGVSANAKLIKCIDRADNLREAARTAPLTFSRKYLAESVDLYHAIKGYNDKADAELLSAIVDLSAKIGPQV